MKKNGRDLQTAEAQASIKNIKFPLKSFFLSPVLSLSVFEQRVCVSASLQ